MTTDGNVGSLEMISSTTNMKHGVSWKWNETMDCQGQPHSAVCPPDRILVMKVL